MHDLFIIKCWICGKPVSGEPALCLATLGPRCADPHCWKMAREYAKKRDNAMREFAEEKERLLRPWQEKLTAELFLLGREYLKGKPPEAHNG